MSFDAYIPGATAVGVAYKDGVVLGAERRITLANYVISKKGRKVFRMTDNVGAVCAGMVADMQNLVKEVGVYSKLKELEAKRQLSAAAVAKLTSVIMFERRFSPLLTQVILGGVDQKPKVWVLDPLGSLITDEYASVGTGAEMATGVLEAGYAPGLSEKEARELTVSSIKASIARDTMSGNGIDILTLDRQGFREESISA
ncbi:MAG: proteasome subunit beta [Nitrososphaerota archaeon]|nr:proteasome subunit beta [Nitrososphaerota archaeon]MDG7020477.1 proteasome subunit beta [Nitrososphaerota archaeon]